MFSMYRWQDLNLQGGIHPILSGTCLPISAHPFIRIKKKSSKKTLSARDKIWSYSLNIFRVPLYKTTNKNYTLFLAQDKIWTYNLSIFRAPLGQLSFSGFCIFFFFLFTRFSLFLDKIRYSCIYNFNGLLSFFFFGGFFFIKRFFFIIFIKIKKNV